MTKYILKYNLQISMDCSEEIDVDLAEETIENLIKQPYEYGVFEACLSYPKDFQCGILVERGSDD